MLEPIEVSNETIPALNLDLKYHNINGLGDKLGHNDIIEDILKRDIVVYSEAMKGPDFEYSIPGFSVKTYPHSSYTKCKRRVPGGFVLIVRNSIEKNVKVVKHNDHVLWLKITNLVDDKEFTFFLGAVYIPHERSRLRNIDNNELDSVQKDIELFSTQGTVYPLGDWNSRTGNLIDFVYENNALNEQFMPKTSSDKSRRLNVDQTINAQGRKLIDLCKSSGYQIQNGRKTEQSNVYTCYRHNGQSTVDYLLARHDRSHLIKNFQIGPRTVDSDHCAITFSLPRRDISYKPDKKSSDKEKRDFLRYKWVNSKKPDYHKNLSSTESKNRADDFICSVGSKYFSHSQTIDKFYDFIMPPVKETFKPVRKNKKRRFPVNDWFDAELKTLKRQVNDQLKIDPWSERANDLKKEYHRIRQQKKRACKKGISSKAHDLKANKPQDFWDFWKSHVKKRENCDANIIDVDEFTNYYENVASNHLTANDTNYNHDLMEKIEKLVSDIDIDREMNTYIDNPVFDCLNGPIQIEEIENALKRTKNRKAAGCDGLVSEFLKNGNGHLEGPLSALFNYILNSGEYPDQWCEGFVNPIHKKDSKYNPANYRKITVLPALGKLFDTILNTRLTTIKDIMQSYDKLQFGFKEKHGSIDNAFILDSIIEISKMRGRPTYVCYIDLKSAFDMIVRAALLWKMRKQGIRGKFYAIINSMFKKAKSTVKWAGDFGETFENLCGVLQGGVTSPQLFKVFLEDLVKYLDTSCGIKINEEMICHLLLADDLALISETKWGLQRLLNGFSNFCKQWHLVVNMDKTKFSVFNSQLAPKQKMEPLLYNGEEVKETEDYLYVGINFSTAKDRFAKHIENVAASAKRAVFGAMSLARNACGGELSALTHIHIFDTQIRPVLEYASSIWFTNSTQKIIEKVQTDFLKRSLGVGNSTPHLALYGETNKFPLLLRQQYAFLKYWTRLSQMPEGSILSNIYKEHVKLNSPYMSKVRSTLEAAGVIPTSLPVVTKKDTPFFLRVIRHNLEFLYKTKWYNEINDSNKNPMLRFYKTVKTTFGLESYIKLISDRKIQTSISKFRLSSHCLRIHKGRHERDKNGINTPANRRFCLSCKSGEIDNELHLLDNCQTHNEERETLKNRISPQFIHNISSLSSFEILRLIFSSVDRKVLFELGRFLKTSFNKRKLEYQNSVNV